MYRGTQVTLQPTKLLQEMTVANEGSTAFEFTAALHSYFRVADITQVLPTLGPLTAYGTNYPDPHLVSKLHKGTLPCGMGRKQQRL